MIYSLTLLLLLVNVDEFLCAGEKHMMTIESFRKDENVQTIFHEAIRKYNQQINSIYLYAPYQVHKVSTQVVAGILYEFEVTLFGSNCRKRPNDKAHRVLLDCGINESLTPKRVHLQIFHRPWLAPQFLFRILGDVQDHDVKLHDQLFIVGFPEGDIISGLNFEKFKNKYNRKYDTQEEEIRRQKLFQSNFKRALLMKFIDKGTAEYGITQFSDFTEEEFVKQYLSPPYDLTKLPKRIGQIPQDIRTAQAIDWRKLGAVSPVKNQGSCGSCWAFSTTGNIEGQWFLKTKNLISLSEQQLVDCDTIDEGCNGGLPSQAYKAIEQMGGLESENDYPYKGVKGSCQLSKSKIKVYINDSETIPSSEVTMASWNSISGPISIGINAFAMQFYRGGISHPFSFLCNPNHLDHGVLIVGFNTTVSGEPFWIVKNSWGATWGEQGYYLVYRGSGVCGLNKMPTSAKIY